MDTSGNAIIAAKRLASMLPASDEAQALQRCGLGAMVDAQQKAREEGEEEDIEAYLQRCFAESSDDHDVDYRMYDSKGVADNPFDEEISHADRRTAYLGALCCITGGRMNDKFYGQWLALHVPFRHLEDLEDETARAPIGSRSSSQSPDLP